MRVKDMSISKGMTINLGNRTFTKVEVGLTATLDDSDDFAENFQKLTDLVNIKLAKEVEMVLPKRQTLMEGKKKRPQTREAL